MCNERRSAAHFCNGLHLCFQPDSHHPQSSNLHFHHKKSGILMKLKTTVFLINHAQINKETRSGVNSIIGPTFPILSLFLGNKQDRRVGILPIRCQRGLDS